MRQQLFGLGEIVDFLQLDIPEAPANCYGIFPDIQKFIAYSQLLTNKIHVTSLIEKTLAYYLLGLPGIVNGRKLYQLRVQIRNDNPGEAGEAWFEQYETFQCQCYSTIYWIRFSRAIHATIENPTRLKELAGYYNVSAEELRLVHEWYETRAKLAYGEKRPGNSWIAPICDEETRFRSLYHELFKHASRKLASPSFAYLSRIYEDRTVLIHVLLERAWTAVLITADQPEVNSLKLAKQYINTEIHHLAKYYTSTNKKQIWNPETQEYENMELNFFSNPEMDESKHACLAYKDPGYEEVEIFHTISQELSARELKLVQVLAGFEEHPEFELFAAQKVDRRMAAFEFFHVSEQTLGECLKPLLGF